MSNTQFAFLNKEDVPSRSAWQEAIDKLDFKIRLELHPTLSPFEDEGFSPCTWNETDEDVGFEIFYEPSEEIHEDDDKLIKIIGDKDFCISMCWGGSMKDCAAAMIASTALAKSFGAVVSYEGEEPEKIDAMLVNTRSIIDEAELEEEALNVAKEIESAKTSGPASELIIKELTKIAGCEVSGMGMGGMLMIGFSNGSSITAKAFSCRTQEGVELNVSKYAKIRSQQMALMEGCSGEFTDALRREWDKLEPLKDAAELSDEKVSALFSSEVESWPEKLYVDKVEMPEINIIEVSFSNVPNVKLGFYALDGMLFNMSFQSGNLRFTISDVECELAG